MPENHRRNRPAGTNGNSQSRPLRKSLGRHATAGRRSSPSPMRCSIQDARAFFHPMGVPAMGTTCGRSSAVSRHRRHAPGKPYPACRQVREASRRHRHQPKATAGARDVRPAMPPCPDQDEFSCFALGRKPVSITSWNKSKANKLGESLSSHDERRFWVRLPMSHHPVSSNNGQIPGPSPSAPSHDRTEISSESLGTQVPTQGLDGANAWAGID